MEENLPEQQSSEKKQPVTPRDEVADKPTIASSQKSLSARSKPGWIVWGLTTLLALAGIGVSVYVSKTGEHHQQKLQADLAGVIQRVSDQSNRSLDIQRELDRFNDQSNRQQQQTDQQIENLKQQLSSQQKEIRSLSTTDRDDWLLAEIEYLLHLANQRLLMGKEVKGAQKLLRAADNIVRELDDHALYPVRQALADEIAALHSAGSFDLEGVYLRIDAVAHQVDQLRLLTQLKLDTQLPPTQPSSDWQQRLELGVHSAWQKLLKYIQINRRDDIYKPDLSPEYEMAVRQNVRLMLEQAQMALLSGKQSLYEISLDKAKYWLNTYYTLDKESTTKVVMIIDELKQQNIMIVAPDISGSLRALKNYMETLHLKETNKKQNVDSNTTTEDSLKPELTSDVNGEAEQML